MDKVQEEIENNYLISQFEHAIDQGGDRADRDGIYNNPAAMLYLAEHEYKQIHAKDILNRPSHVCSKQKGCRMIMKHVVAYRKTTWIGNSIGIVNPASLNNNNNNNIGNMFAEIFGTGANPANYQICFEDECEHLTKDHYCIYEKEMGIQCHHRANYDPTNIKRLNNFWICADSGNVHACGSLCQQPKIMSTTECDYVCSLTGVITSRNIINEAPFSSNQRLLSNEVPDNNNNGGDAGGTVGNIPISNFKRKRNNMQFQDEAAYEASLKTWENEVEMERNRILINHVVDETFFSKKRQMIEANIFLTQYEDAMEEVSKYMRTKKQQLQQLETEQKTVNMIMALCILQYKMPTSIYFKNVPIMPSIRRYILNGMSKLDYRFISNNGVDVSCYDTDYAGSGRDYTEINKLISRSIKSHRDRQARLHVLSANTTGKNEQQQEVDEDLTEKERVYEEKTLNQWMNKIDIVKKMFSVGTIAIWRQINKNLHEMREFEKMTKFKNIVIPLLYMMRKQFSITENTASLNNLNSLEKVYKPLAEDVEEYTEFHFSERFAKAGKMIVTVIPKIEFALLLPNENQLHKFDLNNTGSSQKVFTDYYSEAHKRYLANKQQRQQDESLLISNPPANAAGNNNNVKQRGKGRASTLIRGSGNNNSNNKKGSNNNANNNNNNNNNRQGSRHMSTGVSINKKITKMQIKMKRVIKMIANSGRLASMQLRMEDISQEIINKM